MPELPEVETTMRGVEPYLLRRRIESLMVREPRLRWPIPDAVQQAVGQPVDRLERRAKYIIATTTKGNLMLHLGMSGSLRVITRDEEPRKHDHFDIVTDAAILRFNDPRRFGAMDLAPTPAVEQHKLLAVLGPEPLGNSFDETYLAETLVGRKTPIKSALLDQKVVAGLGNIYVCEVLHRAGISPTRTVARISRARLSSLVPLIRDVLNEAIAAGGSSLRDYRQTDGELGYFQHAFAVYDREGESCQTPDCGGQIMRIVQSGRSSFYCPKCQR